MKKLLTTSLLTIFMLGNQAHAQLNPIEVTYGPGVGTQQSDFIFRANNITKIDYHVVLDFDRLIGLQSITGSPLVDRMAGPGIRQVFRLVPGSTTTNVRSFRYILSYHPGEANPKLKKGIEYMLPVGKGKSTEVFGIGDASESGGFYLSEGDSLYGTQQGTSVFNIIELEIAGNNGGNQDDLPTFFGDGPLRSRDGSTVDFYSTGFKLNEGDTVYAVRNGVVAFTRDDVYDSNDPDSKDQNYVRVFHKDGSQSTYVVFQRGGLLVEEGQPIEAGDPIGIAGGSNFDVGHHVKLYVSYLKYNNDLPRGERYSYGFLVPKFRTKDGQNVQVEEGKTYVGVHPEELIIQEMSKREIKKRKKSK